VRARARASRRSKRGRVRTIGGVASLTKHLETPDSPVRAFMAANFPAAPMQRSRQEIAAALEDGPTVGYPELAAGEHGLIGTALDYRIRYWFGITPASQFVAARGVEALPRAFDEDDAPDGFMLFVACRRFIAALDDLVASLDPINRRLDVEQEESLDRQCIVLALLEQLFRVGPRPGSRLLAKPIAANLTELLALPKQAWLDDLRELAWAFDRRARDEDWAGRTAMLNPTFVGSRDLLGADADLIVEGCLVEIKTTIQRRVRDNWIDQLLGYVLLDYEDQFQINEVAIYLARQQTTLRWPIGLLLGPATTEKLNALRREFRDLLRTPLKVSAP